MSTVDCGSDLSAKVLGEQAYATFRSRLESLPVSSLLAISIAVMMRDNTANHSLTSWLISILSANVIQIVLALYMLRRQRYQSHPKVTLALCSVGAFMASIIWCYAPLVLFNLSDPTCVFVVIVIAGLTAGAALQGTAYSATSIVFIAPILFASIIKFLSDGTTPSYFLGGDFGVYLLFIVRNCLMSERRFRSSSFLKHEAAALATSLQREHEVSTAANARLFILANHDPLTGLFNRAAFSANLETRLTKAREHDVAFSLLLLDLDGFKSINDTLGHKAGDEVLQHVAAVLTGTFEDQDFVARLGGDEFAVLIDAGGDQAATTAAALIAAISRGVSFDHRSVRFGTSIGIASFPQDCGSTDDMRIRADLALYAAKNSGRNTFRRFDRGMLTEFELSRDLELDLAAALIDRSIEVWYQPQIRLRDERLVGLEALIRWNHPKHGWISPPLIIAAARRAGLSDGVTGFVLEQACHKLRELTQAGDDEVILAINVSPAELEHSALPEMLARMIPAYGVSPKRLELEITEESLVTGDAVMRTFKALSDAGVRLAIDDFGTGCSSIAYLRNLSVDRIKIDRSFVSGFTEREGDRVLVQAIVGLGLSLGIEVVAEGVESAAEALLLQRLGCEVGQGFHFGRPLSSDALRRWIAERTRPLITPTRMISAA